MRDCVGSLFERNVDLPLGNQRPRDGSAQKVSALIHGVGAQHRKDVIFYELLSKIADDHLARAGLDRFALNGLQVFPLTQIRAKSDDPTVILLL